MPNWLVPLCALIAILAFLYFAFLRKKPADDDLDPHSHQVGPRASVQLKENTVRATLKGLHSPDVHDLEKWSPGEQPFGFLLQAMIGQVGQDGEEAFDLMVCTPEWFAASQMENGMLMGSRTLFV